MSSSSRNPSAEQPAGAGVRKKKGRRRSVDRAAALAKAAGPRTGRQLASTIDDDETHAYFGFRLKLRRGADRSRLLVTLSTKSTFMLFRQQFEHDALFVVDRQTAYYAHNPHRLAAAICAIADRFGYDKVSIAGASKAGFGALLVGGLVARLRPSRVVRILAFQPRVHIWPYEPRRIAPGYFEAYAYAAATPKRAESMRRYGDAAFVTELPNVIVQVIYSARNTADRRQARMLRGPNVSYLEVPTAIHNAMATLALVRLPPAETRAGVERLLIHVTAEEQRASGGVDVLSLLEDVKAAAGLPSLAQLVERSFEWTLKPLRPRWTPAVRVRRSVRRAWRWCYWTLYASPALEKRLERLARREEAARAAEAGGSREA